MGSGNNNTRPWIVALLAIASTAVAVGIAWGTLGETVNQALQGCADNATEIEVLEQTTITEIDVTKERVRELEQTMSAVETDVRWIRETLERQYGDNE